MKIQHNQIIEEAKKRNYQVTDVSEMLGTLAATIEKDGKSELIYEGTPLSRINLRSLQYFDNKQLGKLACSKLNIPSPQSILFQNPKDKSLESFFGKNKKYVCKPPAGSEGVGVEMNFTNLEAIEDYWNRNQHLGPVFMLEEQIEGEDLRMQVVGGKIIAACTREPAFVIGDGTNNLNQLIENRQKVIKSQNPMNDLVVDKATLDLLEKQNLDLSDIPVAGQKVVLKELANMSQGAVAIDKMDDLHERYQIWIDQLVEYLEVDYFAIDFITKSFTEDPATNAILLEINAKPEWLHHTFSENRQHDIAAIVLDDVFEK